MLLSVFTETNIIKMMISEGMKKLMDRYREFSKQVEEEKTEVINRQHEFDEKIEQVQSKLDYLRSTTTDKSDLPW